MADPALESTVRDIIRRVQDQGDAAVVDYTSRFDRFAVDSFSGLTVDKVAIEQALLDLDPTLRRP